MPDVYPCRAKNAFELELENIGISVQPLVHPAGPNESPHTFWSHWIHAAILRRPKSARDDGLGNQTILATIGLVQRHCSRQIDRVPMKLIQKSNNRHWAVPSPRSWRGERVGVGGTTSGVSRPL